MATTVTSGIVTEVVTLVQAPEPSKLQQSGAIISIGGTSLTTNSYQYIPNLATLTSILSSTGNYTELTNAATTFFEQGSSVGFYVLELGAETNPGDDIPLFQTWITNNPGIFYSFLVPEAWDGIEGVSSVTITNGGSGYTAAPTVTFSPPTTGTTATGTATIENGSVTAITITDPGSGYTSTPTVTISAPTTGVTATATATLGSSLNGIASNYANPTGKLYFFATTTSANISQYTAIKSLVTFVASPNATSTEYGMAAIFYQWLLNDPGAANKLAPMAYRYVYGVTPWPDSGQTTTIDAILTAYGNIFTTGSEGGVSTSIIKKGTVMSGAQGSWWYGIDWYQINSHELLANAIISGSNSQPPLLYDQQGINTLEAIAQNEGDVAVEFGCALSVTVSATPFYTYTQANPSAYDSGDYKGFKATIVGQNGFLTVTFYIDALTFA